MLCMHFICIYKIILTRNSISMLRYCIVFSYLTYHSSFLLVVERRNEYLDLNTDTCTKKSK